jgi:hypothetical protein
MPGFVESSYPCHNTGDVDEPKYNEHIHETTERMEDSRDLSDHDQPFMQEMKLEDDEPFLSSRTLTPNLQHAAHIRSSRKPERARGFSHEHVPHPLSFGEFVLPGGALESRVHYPAESPRMTVESTRDPVPATAASRPYDPYCQEPARSWDAPLPETVFLIGYLQYLPEAPVTATSC